MIAGSVGEVEVGAAVVVDVGAPVVAVAGVVAGSAIWWFALTTFVGILHHKIEPRTMRNINHAFGVFVTGFGAVVLGDLAIKLI